MRSATNGRSHNTHPVSRNRETRQIWRKLKVCYSCFSCVTWVVQFVHCTVILYTLWTTFHLLDYDSFSATLVYTIQSFFILYEPPSTYWIMILSVPLWWVICVQCHDKWILITVLFCTPPIYIHRQQVIGLNTKAIICSCCEECWTEPVATETFLESKYISRIVYGNSNTSQRIWFIVEFSEMNPASCMQWCL